MGYEKMTIRQMQIWRERFIQAWLAGEISCEYARSRIRWLTSLIERRANDERYADEVKSLFQPIRA